MGYKTEKIKPVYPQFPNSVGTLTIVYANTVATKLAISSIVLTAEPCHENTNNVVSEQVQHKLSCTTTEDG